MPREFLGPGINDQDFMHRIEKEGKEKFSKERVLDPEINEIISKIDFKSLKEDLGEIYARSMQNPSKMNFVEPEDIIILDNFDDHPEFPPFSVAVFDQIHDLILLSKEGKNEFQSEDLSIPVLHDIIHEEVHAIADQKIRINEVETGKQSERPLHEKVNYSSNGYRITEVEAGKGKRSKFRMFNEGVVEHLSREILTKYLKKNKDFASAVSINKYSEYYQKKESPLFFAVELCDELALKISDFTGINKDKVWEGFHRSLIEGFDLMDELMEEFFKTLRPDFAKNLREIGFNNLEALIFELERTDIVVPDKNKFIEKLVQWFGKK